MADSFWSRKLGVTAPPPGQPQTPVTAIQQATPAAWWQTPVSPHAQQALPPQSYQQPGSGMLPGETPQERYQRLKGMRADEMSQQDMETLALLELQLDKYNHACPNCGSTNFLPQGTKIGNARMGTDKCFECGSSSSALTQSPEAAVGGTGGKPGRATKQVAGGAGSYGTHHSQLPAKFIPRNA